MQITINIILVTFNKKNRYFKLNNHLWILLCQKQIIIKMILQY